MLVLVFRLGTCSGLRVWFDLLRPSRLHSGRERALLLPEGGHRGLF